MIADEHVRAASRLIIQHELVRLHAFFHPTVAFVLGRYFAETVERGLPTDAARQALADLLAPHGLADPQGKGRHPAAVVPDVGKPDRLVEEYRRNDLRTLGIGLDVFRAEVARQNRESPRPITPAEVARDLIRAHLSESLSRAPSAPRRLVERARRATRRLARR